MSLRAHAEKLILIVMFVLLGLIAWDYWNDEIVVKHTVDLCAQEGNLGYPDECECIIMQALLQEDDHAMKRLLGKAGECRTLLGE